MEYIRLSKQLSIISGKPLLEEFLRTLPVQWYHTLFEPNPYEEFVALSGPEWKLVSEISGIPQPPSLEQTDQTEETEQMTQTDQTEETDYTQLMEHLSFVSDTPLEELLEAYLKTLPDVWYKTIMETKTRYYTQFTGAEWKLAREKSGLPFPTVYYGSTSDKNHPIPSDIISLCTEYNQRTKQEVIQHVRDEDYICRGKMGVSSFGSELDRSHSLLYAYYNDEIIQQPIVIGIILIYYRPDKQEIVIPILCTDGSYNGIGTILLDMVKGVLLLHPKPYHHIKLDALASSYSFYIKNGFIRKKNYDLEWKPSLLDITTCIKTYPDKRLFLEQKWSNFLNKPGYASHDKKGTRSRKLSRRVTKTRIKPSLRVTIKR